MIAVVIIASAGLVLAVGAIFLSLDHLAISSDRASGSKALALADGCLRLGLRHLELDDNYRGENLSLGAESCIIKVTGERMEKTVLASAVSGNYSRAVEAEVVIASGVISVRHYRLPDGY